MDSNRECKVRGPGGTSRCLSNEGGFLLVIAMLIMLAVSTIAAANLVNAMLERTLAKNQNYASLSLQAAEAGIAEGLAWVNVNMGSIPDPTANRGWTQTIATRDLSRDLNGDGDTLDEGERLGSYSVKVHFKREWNDYSSPSNGICKDAGEISENHDNDGNVDDCDDAEVVIYNRCSGANGCFNFPDAIYAGPDTNADPFERGYPVIEIDSEGTFGGAGYRRVLMDVARDLLEFPGLKGAVTAGGGYDFGNSNAKRFDGKTHKADGSVGHTNPKCADAELPDTMYETGKPHTNNKPANFPNDGAPTENLSGEPLCTTPWCALGFDTQAQLEAAAAPYVYELPAGFSAAQQAAMDATVKANIVNGRIVYYKNRGATFDPSANLTGILILEGTYFQRGNDVFTGLMVVKNFDANGTPGVTGGIIQYDTANPGSYSNGNVNVLYSCDALMEAKMKKPGLYTNKLSWHRLR